MNDVGYVFAGVTKSKSNSACGENKTAPPTYKSVIEHVSKTFVGNQRCIVDNKIANIVITGNWYSAIIPDADIIYAEVSNTFWCTCDGRYICCREILVDGKEKAVDDKSPDEFEYTIDYDIVEADPFDGQYVYRTYHLAPNPTYGGVYMIEIHSCVPELNISIHGVKFGGVKEEGKWFIPLTDPSSNQGIVLQRTINNIADYSKYRVFLHHFNIMECDGSQSSQRYAS
jgi:hypothetical protein